MKALALDTTTRAGSVALVVDDRVFEERAGDPTRSQAERLPRELLAVAESNDVALSDVDLFAVAAGPGSFTGLRIGIATVQGLAFVSRKPIVGVSALEALAQIATVDAVAETIVAVWMDAHRHEVFSALYRVTHEARFTLARLAELDPASAADPLSILARWRAHDFPEPTLFAGDGAMMYADTIVAEHAGARVVAAPLIAGTIGRLAIERARVDGAVDPAGLQPLYVRRPDVELAREQGR